MGPSADFSSAAPFVIALHTKDVILAKRIDAVDLVITEEDLIKAINTKADNLTITIDNKTCLESNLIDFIISPYDYVLGEADEYDTEGYYIGIDPVLQEFIIRDSYGVVANVYHLTPSVSIEEPSIRKALRFMSEVINNLKEVKEITPEFKESLEGDLDEIYRVLDAEITDD